MTTRPGVPLVALLLAISQIACGRREERTSVTIATTPDVAGSGLVQQLAGRFAAESKLPAHLIVTEERLIPDLVRNGTAGVVLTTSPALRDALRRASLVKLDQAIASNDYLLLGPRRDPARARGAKTAAEALRRIARRDRAFCSPVDVPELRHRESILWEASPAQPDDNRRYRECRGTALEVLQEASRRGAYTLTDRATFELAGKDVRLVPLLQGTSLLNNDLMVILARPAQPRTNAEWFVQWLMSYRGHEEIDRYRYEGGRRFFAGQRS